MKNIPSTSPYSSTVSKSLDVCWSTTEELTDIIVSCNTFNKEKVNNLKYCWYFFFKCAITNTSCDHKAVFN